MSEDNPITTDPVVYVYETENFLQYADKAREAERFTDIRIKSGNVSINAHRLVLASYSEVFERLLLTPMREQYQGTVELDNLDGESVEALVQFMYTKTITVSQENVFDLLTSAHYLQMNEVWEFCFAYLKTNITLENWTAILSALILYENESLLEQVHQFVSENFFDVSRSTQLKEISTKDLFSIFEHLNRAIVKESAIYEATITWIRQDEANRKCELPRLLSLINLHQVSCEFLENVVATDPLVKENNECLNAVMVVLARQLKNMRLKEKSSKIISIGGFYTRSKVFEVYNVLGKSNSVYPDLPDEFCHSKAVMLNKCIYSIGGSFDPNNQKVTSKVYQINIDEEERQWLEICPLNEARNLMGVAVFRNCLVVAGGRTEENRLRSVELFIPAMKKWQQISSLNHARSSVALVACCDTLYAIGGNDGTQELAVVERLEDLDDHWKIAEPMVFRKSMFAAACYNGEIYVFGGSFQEKGETFIMKIAEKYSPLTEQWTVLSDVNICRYGHAVCLLESKIFVVGGWNMKDELEKSIKCYDPLTKSSSTVGKCDYFLSRHSLVAL